MRMRWAGIALWLVPMVTACGGKTHHADVVPGLDGSGGTNAGLGGHAGFAGTTGAGAADSGGAAEAVGGATGSGGGPLSDTSCGNGVLERGRGEECDDGNLRSDDGCSVACRIEWPAVPCLKDVCPVALCGDGRLGMGERCDDGNVADGDGCSAGCERIEPGFVCPEAGSPCRQLPLPPHCGDGVLQSEEGEACDDGTNLGGYGACAPACVRGPYCGDGQVQPEAGEVCDHGEDNSSLVAPRRGGCLVTCQPAPYCGDGVVERDSEACDDGNDQNGDGCSIGCLVEV